MVSPTANSFIFTNLFEACCEAKRWKPQLGFRELNLSHLAWLLQPSPEPVKLNLALHKASWYLLRNLLGNPVEPNPAPAPVHTGAILG